MCMACPHQALASLDMPAATNARVNGDSGMAVPDMVYSSTLAAIVGLGWSKDNLRLIADGWSQGATEVQVLFAALSLGPAGLADQLEGFPAVAKEGAAVKTNRTLAMSLCATNGVLLQMSFPLTVVGAQLAGELATSARKGSQHAWTQNAFATYTTIGSTSTAYTGFIVAAFIWRQSPEVPMPSHNASLWTLHSSDLSELIDCENYPPTPFHEVPNGAYKDSPQQAQHDCTLNKLGAVIWFVGSKKAMHFSDASGVQIALSDAPTLSYVSPVADCGIALLGEEGKVAMLSTYRFAAVFPDPHSPGLHVNLRGEVGERVTLLYVRISEGLTVQRLQATVGPSGTVGVTISQA